jgi:hypothetical protein
MIASGNFVGVSTQIFHHRLWTSKGFCKNNPRFALILAEFVRVLWAALSFSQYFAIKPSIRLLQGTEIYRPFGCFTIAPLC